MGTVKPWEPVDEYIDKEATLTHDFIMSVTHVTHLRHCQYFLYTDCAQQTPWRHHLA